jgi:hypothetical protein
MRLSGEQAGGDALPGMDMSDARAGVLADLPVVTIRKLLDFSESLYALGDSQADTAGIEAQGMAFHQLMYCGEVDLLSAARVLQLFPQQALSAIIPRIYPEDALYAMTSVDSLRLVRSTTSLVGC